MVEFGVRFGLHAFDEVLSGPVEKLGHCVGLDTVIKSDVFQRFAFDIKRFDKFALAIGQVFDTEMEEAAFAGFLFFALDVAGFHHLFDIGIEQGHGGFPVRLADVISVVIPGDGTHPGDHIGSGSVGPLFFPGGDIGELEEVVRIGPIAGETHQESQHRNLSQSQFRFEWIAVIVFVGQNFHF